MLLTAWEGRGRRGRGRGEAEIVGAKWSRRLRLMRARQNMRDGRETRSRRGRGGYELEEKENREGRGVALWQTGTDTGVSPDEQGVVQTVWARGGDTNCRWA